MGDGVVCSRDIPVARNHEPGSDRCPSRRDDPRYGTCCSKGRRPRRPPINGERPTSRFGNATCAAKDPIALSRSYRSAHSRRVRGPTGPSHGLRSRSPESSRPAPGNAGRQVTSSLTATSQDHLRQVRSAFPGSSLAPGCYTARSRGRTAPSQYISHTQSHQTVGCTYW